MKPWKYVANFKHSASTLLDGVAISYITTQENGFVSDINIQNIIEAYNILAKNESGLDLNAGVVLLIKEGSKVAYGDKLVRIFYSIGNESFFKSINPIKEAIKIGKNKPSISNVFYKVIV